MNLLEGRKAIVTGGAQGLGAAISEHVAEEGCDVVIWDINRDVAAKTASEIAQRTGRAVAFDVVDVTDAARRARRRTRRGAMADVCNAAS